jgi:hypothetical protein
LKEMQREEKEAELVKLRAAMRPSIIRLPKSSAVNAAGGDEAHTAAPHVPIPPHAAPPIPGAAAAAGSAVASATDPSPAAVAATSAARPYANPRRSLFAKLRDTLESWRTDATVELLSPAADPPWEDRLEEFSRTMVSRNPADGSESSDDPQLPPVDSRSQRWVRRSALTGQLQASLPPVLEFLELPPHAVHTELTAMIATLEIHMDTVHFVPTEWLVFGTVLLVALAGKVDVLREAWGAPSPDASVTKLEYWIHQIGLDAPSFTALVETIRDKGG